MSTITSIHAQTITQFRATTGLPLMECKRLLQEADGDRDLALKNAKQQGLAPSDKPLGQRPGYIGTYRHHNGQIGAMVVIRCNSDTLARTEEFRRLCDDIAMHVTVADPRMLRRDTIPADIMSAYVDDVASSAKLEGKPEAIKAKILSGLLEAKLKQACLMDQLFIRPDANGKTTITISSMIDDLSARSREPIEIEHFRRFTI